MKFKLYRALLTFKAINTLCFIIITGLIAWLLLPIVTRSNDPSGVQIISKLSSPDNKWIAITEVEQYGEFAGSVYYATILKSSSETQPIKKRIFKIGCDSTEASPQVKWLDENHLSIKLLTKTNLSNVTPDKTDEISILVTKFNEIHIVYNLSYE